MQAHSAGVSPPEQSSRHEPETEDWADVLALSSVAKARQLLDLSRHQLWAEALQVDNISGATLPGPDEVDGLRTTAVPLL